MTFEEWCETGTAKGAFNKGHHTELAQAAWTAGRGDLEAENAWLRAALERIAVPNNWTFIDDAYAWIGDEWPQSIAEAALRPAGTPGEGERK